MTTAARPTWDTAKGGTSTRERDLSSMSKQYSSRDLPSHTRLKTRETGQGTSDEIRQRDFRRDLEDRERVALRERQKERARKEGKALVSRQKLFVCFAQTFVLLGFPSTIKEEQTRSRDHGKSRRG